MHHENGKSLGVIAGEVKNEFKEFVSTRIQMLQSEMREKSALLKAAIPLLVVGALFALSAWAVLTWAFVAGLATLFEGQYAWLFAALIVAAVYLLIGGVAGWMGYRQLTSQSLAPNRTLRVLKQDQLWLVNEARSQ